MCIYLYVVSVYCTLTQEGEICSVLLSFSLLFLPLFLAFSLCFSLLIWKVEQPLPITSPKKGSRRASVTQMEEAWRQCVTGRVLSDPSQGCLCFRGGGTWGCTNSILLPLGFSRGGVQIGAACVSGDIRSVFRRMRIWYDRLQRRATAYTLSSTRTDTNTLKNGHAHKSQTNSRLIEGVDLKSVSSLIWLL